MLAGAAAGGAGALLAAASGKRVGTTVALALSPVEAKQMCGGLGKSYTAAASVLALSDVVLVLLLLAVDAAGAAAAGAVTPVGRRRHRVIPALCWMHPSPAAAGGVNASA